MAASNEFPDAHTLHPERIVAHDPARLKFKVIHFERKPLFLSSSVPPPFPPLLPGCDDHDRLSYIRSLSGYSVVFASQTSSAIEMNLVDATRSLGSILNRRNIDYREPNAALVESEFSDNSVRSFSLELARGFILQVQFSSSRQILVARNVLHKSEGRRSRTEFREIHT